MEFVNPIDKDKVAENPGLLPYANHVGSAIIRPIDKGRTKGNAMTAMYQQTEKQLLQIKEQVELLIKQAQSVHDRIDLSEKIYRADIGFKPIVGHTYFLYEKTDHSWFMSLVGPSEWGRSKKFTYLATIQLMADHTWDILEKSADLDHTVDIDI